MCRLLVAANVVPSSPIFGTLMMEAYIPPLLLLQEALFHIHPARSQEDLESYHPEDGGDMFLQNVGSYYSHTV
jgi:hypothetical protein